MNIDLKDNKSNIRHRGNYTIEYKSDVISRSTNKIIRYIDIVDEE